MNQHTNTSKKIKPLVFYPPFIIFVVAIICSLLAEEQFLNFVISIQDLILKYLGAAFCYMALASVFVVGFVFFSPLAKVRIGGAEAKPLLTRWRWFSVTLCTTIAIGILFWAAAEPLFHLAGPPEFSGVPANSAGAAKFALSTMFLHWTVLPYAIYTIPTLVFALSFYNMNNDYSLSALLQPFFKKKISVFSGSIIDAICLYSLVAGMAAGLGVGILTLAAGVEKFSGMPSGPLAYGLIAASIVSAFCLSAVSGLMKGIRVLSDWNTKVFIAFCFFFFVCGPTLYIVSAFGPAFLEYVQTFISRSVPFGSADDQEWLNQWTVFYWAVWMAWAPVTAVFLGRISCGYTVRECIVFNLVLPAVFSTLWMSVFSGASLFYEMNGHKLSRVLTEDGPGHVIFKILEILPFTEISSALFLAVSFLSFVTAADSSTTAMGGLSTAGINKDEQESRPIVKIVWGVTVGAAAWVMVSYAGIDGVKITSNLGGVPALLLLVPVAFLLIGISLRPKKFLKKL